MAIEKRFRDQVELLMQVLPIVAEEKVFALKGGTAINLFVRDMPRLSVDIDLAFLPKVPRAQALPACAEALERIANRIQKRLNITAERQTNRRDELRISVQRARTRIKIEVSPVLRGTLHPPVVRDVLASVEDEFGFASMPVVSLPDLYGGKICAALDRQHPRDWFDVMQLLDADEFDRSIFLGFIVYLLGHPRPMNEVLYPRWKSLKDQYENQFLGMLNEPVSLEALETTRSRLLVTLSEHMVDKDIAFLMSFKQGKPDWSLLPLKEVSLLPAVRWKLQNISTMALDKHAESVNKLEAVLAQLKAGQLPSTQ